MLIYNSFIRRKLFITAIFLFSGLIFANCKIENSEPNANRAANSNGTYQDVTPATSEPKFDLPNNNLPLPKAAALSALPKDAELRRRIDETIETSEFRNSRWGVFVVSLDDNRVLAARDAEKTFNPASTQKLMTTAVALGLLGADYRWKTGVYAAKNIDANGVLDGDLILKGHGAPDFDEPDLANLVEQLKQKGLKKITGGVIGDASHFRADNLGDGWTWNEAQWYYGAEPSALSYSDNTVLVEVAPANEIGAAASVKFSPESEFITLTNRAVTIANGAKEFFGVHRDLDANNFQIWGEIPRGKTFAARTTMHEPEKFAANELKKSLEKNSITVAGAAKSVDWRTNIDENSNQVELAAVESDVLSEIVKRTNKRSINLNAELMLRTIGRRERERSSSTESKTKLNDDLLGAMAIKNWLSAKSVALEETVIADGSGLSRMNFVSPETMGRLLVFAAKMKTAETFKNSLPIAGTDGTLGGRLTAHKDRAFAKTGTIAYVSALAGYAEAKSGEKFAFAIFCNNETRPNDSTATLDRIAALILNYGDAENPESNSNLKK